MSPGNKLRDKRDKKQQYEYKKTDCQVKRKGIDKRK
jgi:hypothetical protein